MGKGFVIYIYVVVGVFFLSISSTEQLQSSQAQTLLRIQKLLGYPAVLSSWKDDTNFCNTDSNSSLTVVCYEDSITQLHIIGENRTPPLPQNFSMESFITTLVRVPNLKVLTLASLGLWGQLPGKISRLSSLEIFNISSNYINGPVPEQLSSLKSLQTLILDDNMFAGRLPDWLGSFPLLTVLSLRHNMFNGSLPDSFGRLENLRVLSLSYNHFLGEVPALSSLTNLQVLDLEDNSFEGQFPKLGNKLITLILRKNRFRSAVPTELSSYYQLEHLDLSVNSFVGPFPQSLLSLPSIVYVDIAKNKFTGLLSENQSCNDELTFVDLSSNLLTGSLPGCLSDSKKRDVSFANNCLASIDDQSQHPISFCRNEALAVGIIPSQKREKKAFKTVIALGIVGGIIGGVALVGLIYLIIRRTNANRAKGPPTRLIAENASTGYPSKLLTDARYISQTMKLGALGLPAYRTFSLEEIEEATSNFDSSSFMGEGSHGQMYRGQLKNGSMVAIRCVKMKKSHSINSFMHHIELISKLRHCHVVSALGHCFECYWDDSSVSRLFLLFEYVPNGSLRSWISGQHSRQQLSWAQRITTAIGVARGIQFLHTGIVPGLYSNKLKITDVLMDQNLVAKISSYNLPLLAEELGKDGNKFSAGGSKDATFRIRTDDKSDIYNFGAILLEIIVGRPFKTKTEINTVKDRLQSSLGSNDSRRSILDPAVQRGCSGESLRTMMEICVRCLQDNPEDRPSVEDVLWNLQFAAQVQDAWRGDSLSSEGSPGSPTQLPRLDLTVR